MDKEKIRYLLFPVLMLSCMKLYSQKLFTKELKWEFYDSTSELFFRDKEAITEWSKNQLQFSTTYLKDVNINNRNICVSIVSGCSGLPCWRIYIFNKINGSWQLLASSKAIIKEQIEVESTQENVIFKTKSGKIGELPFSVFGLDIER